MKIIKMPFKEKQVFKSDNIYFIRVKKKKKDSCYGCIFEKKPKFCRKNIVKCHKYIFIEANKNEIDFSKVINLPLCFEQIFLISKNYYKRVNDPIGKCFPCDFNCKGISFCNNLDIGCRKFIFKKIELNKYEELFSEII